jgi:hypothetical protein
MVKAHTTGGRRLIYWSPTELGRDVLINERYQPSTIAAVSIQRRWAHQQ